MKCHNCKKKIPKGLKFCKYCGAEVKPKKRGGLTAVLAILICVLLLAAAAAVYVFMFGIPDFAGSLLEEKSTEAANEAVNQAEELDFSAIDTENGTPILWLKVEADDVVVGRQSDVSFVVEVPNLSYESVVIVNEEDSSVLTTLTKQRQTSEGTVELYGNYTFLPQETAFMRVRAYSGSDFSPVGFISVDNPISEEENDEFVDVFTSLGEYVNKLDVQRMSESDVLDAVETWLKNNDNIAEVSRDGDRVYYRTKSGISSYFTTETPEEGVIGFSSNDKYDSDTTTVSNYDEWGQYGSSMTRQGEEDIVYDFSDITITNCNTLMLRPEYNYDGNFGADFYDDILEMARNSEHFGISGKNMVDNKSSSGVFEMIRDRDLLDYGDIYFSAHGGDKDDWGNNYCFEIINTTNADEWESFQNKYGQYIMDKNNQIQTNYDTSWEIYEASYVETVETEYNGSVLLEFKTHYRILISSRYIMDIYQDYHFDNPIIWMISCHATKDEEFNNFLLNHGVQCIIGSDEAVYFVVWEQMVNSVIECMYNNRDENARLSNAWKRGVNNGICTYSNTNNGWLLLDDYVSYYNEVHPDSPLSADMINNLKSKTINTTINGVSGDFVIDPDMITEYNVYTNGHFTDFSVVRVYTEDVDLNHAGTFDYYYTVTNRMKYLTKNSDFAYGGIGTLTGTVKKGNTVRTIFSDGTYVETTDKNEPLEYAYVKAERFVNQRFEAKDANNYTKEISADRNGQFTFDAIDWGLYVVEVESSSYSGEASIILTSEATDGGDIIAYSGYSAINGYVQGYLDDTKTSSELLDGAKVMLTSVKEIDGEYRTYSYTTKSGGQFDIDDIYAGEYYISITHEDYEDYAATITLKKGYEYEYRMDCFILENAESDMDVVLVLDVSGSMGGTPINMLKSAVNSFADSMLQVNGAENCRVSVVAFSDNASTKCEFTKYKANVYSAAGSLGAGGGTDFEAGLSRAYSALQSSKAKKKVIVLMSDGCPNQGKQGSSLISYASDIKADGITIYTQGFFSELGSGKAEAQSLMESLGSSGFHYEIDDINALSDFYDDLADVFNGQNFDYARIACPVDVSVTYNGETLNSAEDSLCTRTSFGTLTFEEEEDAAEGSDSRIKILRLKSGPDYEVEIVGTGRGTMNYTVGFADEEGDYSDLRKFRNVKITPDTVIDTTVGNSKQSILNVDEDGDGVYDIVYSAGKNEYGKEVTDSPKMNVALIAAVGIAAIILLILVLVLVLKLKKRKVKINQR